MLVSSCCKDSFFFENNCWMFYWTSFCTIFEIFPYCMRKTFYTCYYFVSLIIKMKLFSPAAYNIDIWMILEIINLSFKSFRKTNIIRIISDILMLSCFFFSILFILSQCFPASTLLFRISRPYTSLFRIKICTAIRIVHAFTVYPCRIQKQILLNRHGFLRRSCLCRCPDRLISHCIRLLGNASDFFTIADCFLLFRRSIYSN